MSATDSERTDRPRGTVDEDANPPLTDSTTDVQPDPEKPIVPRDTGSAVPPYEGRQQSSTEAGTAGRGDNEQQSPSTGHTGTTTAAQGSGQHDDSGVGPAHTPGTGRAENKS